MAEESFHNNFFDTEYLKTDLKGLSVRGGAVTMAAQGAKFVLQMGSTVVLARLLTPQDFGLIAMVTVVTGFVMMFKDMGLSTATVQKAEINHGQISTLFWINVILSLGIMLVTAALAPAIAWFYGEPRLTWITLALAGAFIFGGLTIQHQALLRRNMRFGTLALIHIVSMLVGILTAIIAALYGAGYWSLVIGQLAGAIAGAITVWLACGWRPGLPVRRSGVRDMLKFGGHLTGFNFINYFSRNADNILIGRFIGTDALGLYAKAYHLFMMPITIIRQPINNVAIPILSALRNDHERYRKYYRQIIFLVAALTMPLVGFMMVYADNLISLMLGKQWLGAVPVFQILTAVGFIQAAAQSGRGLPLISMGFGRLYFYSGIIQSVFTVLGIAIGLRWGINGVAAGYGITYCLLIPLTIPWYLKGSPVSSRDWLLAIYTPALAVLVMVPIMIWIKRLILPDAHFFDLSLYTNIKVILFGGLGGTTAYGLVLLALPFGRESLLRVLKPFKGACWGGLYSLMHMKNSLKNT